MARRDNTLIAPLEVAESRMERGDQEYAYTDDEIVQLIKDERRRAAGTFNSKVSAQREKAIKHYYGEPFGNEREGFSQHVNMEVFESVEDMKTDLLGAFTAGPKPLRFTQEADDDSPEAATQATDYVYGLMFRSLDGYNILHDALHNGMVEKLAVARRCIKTETIVDHEEVELPMEALPVLEQEEDVAGVDILDSWEQSQMIATDYGPTQVLTEMAQVRIRRSREVRRVDLEIIPSSNVYISEHAGDPNKADAVVLKLERTKGELVAEGFSPEQIAEIGTNLELSDDSVEIARHSNDDTWTGDDRSGQRERELVDVLEGYFKVDMDGDGIPERWKFTVAGDVLLDKEQVREFGLHFWSPYRIPHKTIGLSVADLTIDVQRTSSSFMRAIVDNVFMTNTGMKIADLQVIRNPRDLIDNPIGAVVDSPDPDAVKPVAQPQINPATFEAYSLLKAQKDERTGQSRLRSGHNQDAVSHQNSADLIDAMMRAGSRRPSQMARSFAETFLKPIFRGLYKLGVEIGQVQVVPAAKQASMTLDPADWLPERESMEISVALTPSDRLQRAQALIGTYQMLDQNQQLAPLFGLPERYRLVVDIMEATQTADPAYLKNPETKDGQAAVQQAAEQVQASQQAQQQMEQAMLQAKLQEIQAKSQAELAKIQSDMEKMQAEMYARGEQLALEREEFEHKKAIDWAEIELERKSGEDVGRKTNVSGG